MSLLINVLLCQLVLIGISTLVPIGVFPDRLVFSDRARLASDWY